MKMPTSKTNAASSKKRLLLPKIGKRKLKMLTLNTSNVFLKSNSLATSSMPSKVVLFPPMMQVFVQSGAKTSITVTNPLDKPKNLVESSERLGNNGSCISGQAGLIFNDNLVLLGAKRNPSDASMQLGNHIPQITIPQQAEEYQIPSTAEDPHAFLKNSFCQTDFQLLDFPSKSCAFEPCKSLFVKNIETQTAESSVLANFKHMDSVFCQTDTSILSEQYLNTNSHFDSHKHALVEDVFNSSSVCQPCLPLAGNDLQVHSSDLIEASENNKDTYKPPNYGSQTIEIQTELNIQQASVQTQTSASQSSNHQSFQTDSNLDAEIDVLLNDIQTQTELNGVLWSDANKFTNSCTQTCFKSSEMEEDFLSQLLNMETQTDSNWHV